MVNNPLTLDVPLVGTFSEVAIFVVVLVFFFCFYIVQGIIFFDAERPFFII